MIRAKCVWPTLRGFRCVEIGKLNSSRSAQDVEEKHKVLRLGCANPHRSHPVTRKSGARRGPRSPAVLVLARILAQDDSCDLAGRRCRCIQEFAYFSYQSIPCERFLKKRAAMPRAVRSFSTSRGRSTEVSMCGIGVFLADGVIALCPPLANVSPPLFADSATLGFAIAAATMESVALGDGL